MKNYPSFFLNPSLCQTSAMRDDVKRALAGPTFQQPVSSLRAWFETLDSQEPFTQEKLLKPGFPKSKKDNKTPRPGDKTTRITEFKSYQWLKQRMHLTDKDLQESNLTFEQYLHKKNKKIDESSDSSDGDFEWADLMPELEHNDLRLPVFDEDNRPIQITGDSRPRALRSSRKPAKQRQTFLGRKSAQPVLQDISSSEGSESDVSRSYGKDLSSPPTFSKQEQPWSATPPAFSGLQQQPTQMYNPRPSIPVWSQDKPQNPTQPLSKRPPASKTGAQTFSFAKNEEDCG